MANPFEGALNRALKSQEDQVAKSSSVPDSSSGQGANPFAGAKARLTQDSVGQPPQRDKYSGSIKQNISDTMYDGMSHEDALKLYSNLTKSGSRVYKDPTTGQNVAIPKPGLSIIDSTVATAGNIYDAVTRNRKEGEPILEFKANADPIDKASGVLGNMVRSAGSGALAVRDTLSGTDNVSQFEKDFPVYPISGTEKTAAETLPLLVGGYGGAKLVAKNLPQAIEKSSSLVASVAKYFGTASGAATGEALLAPNDTSTGVVGDSAAIPIFQGVDFGD